MLHINRLRNRCYISTLPRVFYTKDEVKTSQTMLLYELDEIFCFSVTARNCLLF